MKMITWILAFVLIGTAIVSCCKKDELFFPPDQLALPFGQWVHQDGVGFLLSDTIYEGRCPTQYVCVWQGLAQGAITMDISGNQHSIPFQIEGLCDATAGPCGNALDTLGYHFQFIQLDPHPDSTYNIPQADYILHLKAEKL